MSRSGYTDDYGEDDWQLIRWRGAVASAIRGRRGQAFLREMLAALDALEARRLIANDLVREGHLLDDGVCAIGAVGRARGLDMGRLDPDDREAVAGAFGIAAALVAEITYENDEAAWGSESPEARYIRVRRWVEGLVRFT
jgi:hypothetical protein